MIARSRRTNLRNIFGAVFILFVTGCSSAAVMNEPLKNIAPSNASDEISMGGYRFGAFAKVDTSPEILVVLAFSGGGKRSAAFSYGVLRGLRDIPVRNKGKSRSLLDFVDIIASVSGGSFTSAYYGLYHDKIFTDFDAAFLKRDIEAYIYGTYLLPWRWQWIFDPLYGTNNKMSEVYDELMFHGATFADLQRQGLPQINIDATDINYGTVFPFNQNQFDLICSDLTNYPIAVAVAASNGFPVLFSPINLKDYADRCNSRMPAWINPKHTGDPLSREVYLERIARKYLDPKQTSYVHLMDGGIADNLAMRGMINAVLTLGGSPDALRAAGAMHIRRILMVSADGQSAANSSWPKERTITGLGQIFQAVSGTQIDAYNFETMLLAKSVVDGLANTIRDIRCKQQPVIDGHPCADVRGYFLHLSLSDIENVQLRQRLQDIPTGLTIPAEDVDLLVQTGESVTRNSRPLVEFARDMEN